LEDFYSTGSSKPAKNFATSLLIKQRDTSQKPENIDRKSNALGFGKKYFLKEKSMNRSK